EEPRARRMARRRDELEDRPPGLPEGAVAERGDGAIDERAAAAGPRHGAREARGVDLDGAGVLRVEGASAAEGEVILEGNRVDRQRGRLKREVHAPAHVGAQTAVRDRHAREAEDLVGGSIADLEDAVLALAADRELRGAGAVDQDRGRRSER